MYSEVEGSLHEILSLAEKVAITMLSNVWTTLTTELYRHHFFTDWVVQSLIL